MYQIISHYRSLSNLMKSSTAFESSSENFHESFKDPTFDDQNFATFEVIESVGKREGKVRFEMRGHLYIFAHAEHVEDNKTARSGAILSGHQQVSEKSFGTKCRWAEGEGWNGAAVKPLFVVSILRLSPGWFEKPYRTVSYRMHIHGSRGGSRRRPQFLRESRARTPNQLLSGGINTLARVVFCV